MYKMPDKLNFLFKPDFHLGQTFISNLNTISWIFCHIGGHIVPDPVTLRFLLAFLSKVLDIS